MLPAMPIWNPAHESQLELDAHELAVFKHAPGGFGKVMIERSAPLQTALHSWGSQAKACACGCRSSGFSATSCGQRALWGDHPVAGRNVSGRPSLPSISPHSPTRGRYPHGAASAISSNQFPTQPPLGLGRGWAACFPDSVIMDSLSGRALF